jgi:hypothetical protein
MGTSFSVIVGGTNTEAPSHLAGGLGHRQST